MLHSNFLKIFPGLQRSFAFLIGLFLMAGSSIAAPTKKITYELEYEPGASGLLVVTMTFEGDPSGTTPISLPMPWGGMEDAHKGLSAISCLNEGCTVSPASNTETAVFVNHAPSAQVTLGYTVTQTWNGEFRNEVRYRPHLADDYLFLIGHAFLATPDNYQGHPVELSFSWKGVPETWARLTSFGTGSSFKTVVADIDDMRSAVYTAGDYRVYGDEIRGVYTFVAIRGEWPFDDRDFAKLTTDTIRNIRGFWNDYNADQYLVTLIPLAGQCCNFGGTGLTDSFALFMTKDGAKLESFEGLLGHELLHNWIGGNLTLEGIEERGYWFSEGFTNYYARLLQLRNGLMTIDDYVADYNKTIEDYYFSSARNASLADIEAGFWTDRDMQRLPYLRGDILAHTWNGAIREEDDETSLDDVMMDLMGAYGDKGGVFSLTALNTIFSSYMDRSILSDVGILESGGPIPIEEGALGACFNLTQAEKIPFDLGFSHENSPKDNVYWLITGVTPGSAAEAAGLRPGMEVAGMSIYYGNTEVPADIYVLGADGNTRKISYVPVGAPAQVPQYVRDEREWSKRPEECEAFFFEN